MRFRLLSIYFCLPMAVTAQTSKPLPCSAPEASQFDFWVGDWNPTWSDSWHRTNHVEKLFGNCTVQENFSGPETNYLEQSWSFRNAYYKIWQTWIDNQGGYIALTGGRVGDCLILITAERTVPASISPRGICKTGWNIITSNRSHSTGAGKRLLIAERRGHQNR